MSVKAKNITEDGLPIFNKSVKQSNVTDAVLPILKKKEDGGTTSKAVPSVVGATPTITEPVSTSVSGGKQSPKDWSSIENAIKNNSDKSREYDEAQNYEFQQADATGGFGIANVNFADKYKKEAKDKLGQAAKQRDQIISAHQQELYQPIQELINTGKYKDFFDPMGNFKAADAIQYFDKIVKDNKAGNYTRDMEVSLLKQAGQYQLDQPQRTKMREEALKKAGINVDQYGTDLLNKKTITQRNNIDLLEKETKARATNYLETLKPKATQIGQEYTQQVNDLLNQHKQGQISEQDANNKLKELNTDYHNKIKQLDTEYQKQVRQLTINAQKKYGNINGEIQNIEKSVSDEAVWQSIPADKRRTIEKIYHDVDSELDRQKNLVRQGLDIISGMPGQSQISGLFEKSVKSGWYSGLANIGSYLSGKGYDNSFIRYLQGKQYEADVNAPAEYEWSKNFIQRAVSGTGTSLGASLPIMLPSIAITAGTEGLGLPELVGTVGAGLASYYGEKAQNTGQVYQQIMDQTGDPNKALDGARRYEDKQTLMMPLYFIEGAGLQNLFKGGIKKTLLGTAQELSQELPTEYWQNYTQAQETEGYKGNFGSYIKEHPETALDVIASTIGQSGTVSMAGKVFNQISSLITQPKAQYYADIIGKHGIDFAMENLQHQFNTGIIDEKQFQAEQEKIMQSAKKLKEYEGLGLKGDDAKTYFTLTEDSNRLKKAISETDDEGLRIGYENKLKENQKELENLVKGKGAYAVFTLPGGGDQTKIVPVSQLNKLDEAGHLNTLIHLSDKVEVKGDENLNRDLQERKNQLGNPAAPDGFYTQSREQLQTEQNKIDELDKSRSILETALQNNQLQGLQATIAQNVLEQAKDNPKTVHDFFKEVADQALNKVAPEAGDPSADAEKAYGKEIVDRAKELFPIRPTLESIQQQASESYKVVEPILQRINNADYINEKELDNAANHLYDVLDQIDKSDMTDEQKQSSANLVEPLIQKMEGYEFRTKTQTSTVTEAKTASIPTKTRTEIKPALEQSAGSKATITTPDGSKATGTLNIRGGQYTLDIPGGQQRVIGEKAITDRDLTLPTEQEMENPIKFDKNGNVESITVKDRNGNLIEIHDAEKALDMAIQLRAEMIGEVPAQLFDNTYEEVQKEISEEKLVSEDKPTEKVEPTKEDISSPKTQEDGKTKKAEETKGVRHEVTPDTGIGTEGVAGSEPGAPLSPPPTTKKTMIGTPKEEWTAIRKAKLQEISAVKDMFEANAERKKWVGIIESALNNLQEMYPDKGLYDAARTRVGYFATLFDNKIAFNPTSEDLAVMEYFKAETEKAINDIQGWDSATDAERMHAIAQYKSLNDDLVSVAKAINPSEAGRAFGFRQSEMRLDPEYGLQIRRMQLLEAKAGEKLTNEEKEWTSEKWDQERELMRQEQELREGKMREEFDKRMSDLKKEYDDKLKQARKKSSKEDVATEKRDDYLKNKGKEWADKIRKGKLGGTYTTIPLLPQIINTAIEGVAKLVQAGYTIADAINKYIKDNNIKDSEGDAIKNHFNRFIDQQIKKEESFNKIKELAEGNKVTTITTDMVSKNLIKDYVESHIGEIEPENILEHVTGQLESILPNLTKEKLTEAYKKTGEFNIPTKQQLQSEYEKDKAKLNKIAAIEKDINDLKSKKNIYSKAGNKTQELQVDKDIASRERELKKTLQDIGLKTSAEDKYSKASYQTRAQAHNDRINSLSNKIDDLITNGKLTKEQESALNKLKGQLDASKIKLDENSKLSQKAVVDNAENLLKKIYSDFDKSLNIKDMIPVSSIRKGLRQAIDKFNSEKEESEQNLKLQRTKDNLERGNAERQRRINAGEFDNEKKPVILTKSDAALIRLQTQRNKLESDIRKKIQEAKDKNKNWKEKSIGMLRALNVAALIYSYATAAKVAFAAVFRPNIEAATKLTFGQVFKATFPEIYNRAKAGGESSSIRAVKESYTALLRQIGEKKMNEIKDKSYNKYDSDREAYNTQQKVVEAITDKNSKEYKAESKKLNELKNSMDNSLLNAASVFVYDFIGSSSIKDSLDAFLYRTNKIERQFGYLDRESIKDGDWADKLGYVIGFIGRSHGALKTFSARANFAAGFVARIEDAIHNGVDVTNADELLKIGNESYLDWEQGKYQQSNYITDAWNNITKQIEKFGKGTEWEKYSKAVSAGLKMDIAITRVPVNILHEAVAEYTFGAFRAYYNIGQEYRKANKEVALNTDLNPGSKEFKEAVKAAVTNMNPKQAATIARCFRKGNFGLGLYAFAAITGLIAFGGFHHKGEKKKKEDELEEGELNPGELMIGKTKQGELLSKIIEHTPAAYPMLFGLNMAKIYSDNIDKGKTTPEAAMDGMIANLEAIEDGIPQTKLIKPTDMAVRIGKGAIRGTDNFWAWHDVDENGNPIVRKAMNYKDHLKLLINDRKEVLTEENYKSAVSILRKYNNAIAKLQKEHGDKQDIEDLKKQRDEEIEEIYRLNKEGQ